MAGFRQAVRFSATIGLVGLLVACGSASTVSTSAGPSAAGAASSDSGGSAQGAGVANGLDPAPSAVRETLAAVALDQAAETDAGVTVAVVGWRDVTLSSGVPGEIAGPGVAFDLTVTNNSDAVVDVSNVVADLRTGTDEVPVIRADREPTVAFTGILEPGATATATYAFNLDPSQLDGVTLFISLNSDTPVVVFRGNAR